MRGIARTLGVSLATVQHHFGTKAELYRAVIDHMFSDVDQLRSLVPERDLDQRIRNGVDASSARPGLLPALLTDRAPGHEERLAHVAQGLRELLGEPAAAVAELQIGHHGRPVDPVAFMVLLLGIATLASSPEALRAVHGIDLSRADERARLAAGLADILAHGLFATPTPNEED